MLRTQFSPSQKQGHKRQQGLRSAVVGKRHHEVRLRPSQADNEAFLGDFNTFLADCTKLANEHFLRIFLFSSLRGPSSLLSVALLATGASCVPLRVLCFRLLRRVPCFGGLSDAPLRVLRSQSLRRVPCVLFALFA
jgi:hypothetical protein